MDKSRLYYQTPYVKSFMCTVERCEASGKGTWLAVLNQTGFYPEGGGQPSDTGTLNQVPVLSVHEKGEEILHELASPLEPGTLAEGIIDWQKRYDNIRGSISCPGWCTGFMDMKMWDSTWAPRK